MYMLYRVRALFACCGVNRGVAEWIIRSWRVQVGSGQGEPGDHRAWEGRSRQCRQRIGSHGAAALSQLCVVLIETMARVGRVEEEVGNLYHTTNQQSSQPDSTATHQTHQVNHRPVSKTSKSSKQISNNLHLPNTPIKSSRMMTTVRTLGIRNRWFALEGSPEAAVLVAVVFVSQVPAFRHGLGGHDGAEGHDERDDDHGEWLDHVGGLRVCVLGIGGRYGDDGGCGGKLMFG
jgi:hypothetical protein